MISQRILRGYAPILFYALLYWSLFVSQVSAQSPVVKVDFNFDGRKEAEVNEPGFLPWPITENTVDDQTFDNIKVKVKGNIRSRWYKAGVQAPYYARLVDDGLTSEGPVELIVSGLPSGQHTLLTFHNTFDSPEGQNFTPLNIYVNGDLAVTKLAQSNRASVAVQSATAYLNFNATAGKDVVFRFEADPASNASNKEVVINGFELNTPNIKRQARSPEPFNGDEHVVLTKDKLTLKWAPAKDVVAHEVYFGKRKDEVTAAGHQSASYKGSQKDSQFAVHNLYSMDTYFWRVDEVRADGKVTKGQVWRFRPAQLAFPGAEGYGRFARGGRGGKVVEVTNLNDSGPGSLREAITRDIGPRTIVFTVSGNIELKSRLVASDPYITIAGQTAPGKGITISRAPLGLTGDDGIIRFVRVRIGAGRTYDGMGLTGADHSIIDHCSISWTIDESFSSRSAHHITLQRTLIAEALNVAGHHKYEKGKMHGFAATIGGDIGSFHHNLLAHCYGRNWSLAGGVDGNGVYTGRLDIRNNVVYNWGHRATDGGAHEVNFVNNYYKPGASTNFFYALNAQHENYGASSQRYYFNGNVMTGHFNEDNQEDGRTETGKKVSYETFVDKPFFPSYVTTQTASEAYKYVLSDVGANQPFFDQHDQRIIQETLDSTYHYKGSISGKGGMLDTEEDAGGWENCPKEERAANWDSDHDGLPDWWEALHHLNAHSPIGDFSDTNADADRNGFTQLDDYMAWMAMPHYFLTKDKAVEIDAKQLFKGFTDKPVYKINEVKNGKAQLVDGEIRFTASNAGLASVEISIEDAVGDHMSRKVGMYISE